MNTNTMFSSKSNEWETPQELYDELDEEFGFTLDPCATHENHKAPMYFTEEENGLLESWDGHIVFMNPPYGRQIGAWVRKASRIIDGVVVCLLPARTDTRWFHDWIYYDTVSIRFIKGRLKFSGHTNSAPFPSMIVIFDNRVQGDAF